MYFEFEIGLLTHLISRFLSLPDQTGESLNLPDSERKALIIAMSLHEKGRFALKRKNYNLALILLLEARNEYSQCRSEILHRADNYGGYLSIWI